MPTNRRPIHLHLFQLAWVLRLVSLVTFFFHDSWEAEELKVLLWILIAMSALVLNVMCTIRYFRLYANSMTITKYATGLGLSCGICAAELVLLAFVAFGQEKKCRGIYKAIFTYDIATCLTLIILILLTIYWPIDSSAVVLQLKDGTSFKGVVAPQDRLIDGSDSSKKGASKLERIQISQKSQNSQNSKQRSNSRESRASRRLKSQSGNQLKTPQTSGRVPPLV